MGTMIIKRFIKSGNIKGNLLDGTLRKRKAASDGLFQEESLDF